MGEGQEDEDELDEEYHGGQGRKLDACEPLKKKKKEENDDGCQEREG